jgi:hypothetical protein
MRHFFIFLIFIFSAVGTIAQSKVIELSHYIFPEFTKGSVLLKTGENKEALLNYNALTQEIVFETNGKKLALDQLNLVDTVYIKGMKFVVIDNKIYEVVFQSKYSLFADNKCSIVDPGKPAAYGGTSQVSSTTSYSGFVSGGQVYEMKLPDGYTTQPYTEYWLLKDGKMEKFLSVRQLSKIFDEKEDLIKKYTKGNKVSFENRESIVGLIKFLEVN